MKEVKYLKYSRQIPGRIVTAIGEMLKKKILVAFVFWSGLVELLTEYFGDLLREML